ncbi:MAG: hypothetical protein M1814_001454 [Vezdaea aestivalis]|nr:MAG: hypothetical protein M1814_001454 [Vezdaea aestivalis]
MSYSFERSERRRGGAGAGRSPLGYWVPLVVSVTAASIGIAAWIWSERSDGSDDESASESNSGRPSRHKKKERDVAASAEAGFAADGSREYPDTREITRQQGGDEAGVFARMSGALRRTPSPQQIVDVASKKVAAGAAAAGAAVGAALTSIREEDREDYVDHSRWSQEAERRNDTGNRAQSAGIVVRESSTSRSSPPGRHQPSVKRKTVAIILSADTAFHDDDEDDHTSLLSHLPSHINTSATRLYILIYSPELKQHPLSVSDSTRPLGSRTSSFSNIGHEDVRTPGEEFDRPLTAIEPNPIAPSSSGQNTPNTPALSASAPPAFNALYAQSQKLVEKDNMVLPFTTPGSFVQLLRHLSPDVVYVQESLSGPGGDAVASMRSWVSQIVVVIGAEGGHGGIVDTEDEDDRPKDNWWRDSNMIGIGKGVEIVDGIRLGEDWSRRVEGQE